MNLARLLVLSSVYFYYLSVVSPKPNNMKNSISRSHQQYQSLGRRAIPSLIALSADSSSGNQRIIILTTSPPVSTIIPTIITSIAPQKNNTPISSNNSTSNQSNVSTDDPQNDLYTTMNVSTISISEDSSPLSTQVYNEPNIENISVINNKKPDNQHYRQPIIDISLVLYSAFVVYVATIKLIYHNAQSINRYFTEPGILIIFGFVWGLIIKRLVPNAELLPRFKSRIFFYLFLPSTILDSASLLANKWLFFNLISILILSVAGTVICSVSLGLTITTMRKSDWFASVSRLSLDKNSQLDSKNHPSYGIVESLVFGTILASFDSTTLLNMLRWHQVNEKLYYLVLGENLMNNAVVIVIYNLLMEFSGSFEISITNSYLVLMRFIIKLFGAILIGIILAAVGMVSIRLVKRFQLNTSLNTYQSQCQAMVETLLILKLAYFCYVISALVGTSTILGLATFGVLQDQYIKRDLSLRSQLTLRQITFATKTLGYSLVYPLIGVEFVQIIETTPLLIEFKPYFNMTEQDLSQDTSELRSFNMNYKLISFIGLLVILSSFCRIIIVILLSQFNNIVSVSQLRINPREQILLAYGGLKGPLSLALVYELNNSNDASDDRNILKGGETHLVMCTVLIMTCICNILQAPTIGPLINKLRMGLYHSSSSNSYVLFNEIICFSLDQVTHGLNAILGRKRTFYDKFFELNEHFIKPSFASSHSNTNWLSIFYDNLVLEETLNANCFHRSIHESARVLAKKTESSAFERANSSISKTFRALRRMRKRSNNDNQVLPMRVHDKNDSEQSLVKIKSRARVNNQLQSNQDSDRREGHHWQTDGSSIILRELIMERIRHDENRTRKITPRKNDKSGPQTSGTVIPIHRVNRLKSLVSWVTNELNSSTPSEIRILERDRYLNELEKVVSELHNQSDSNPKRRDHTTLNRSQINAEPRRRKQHKP